MSSRLIDSLATTDALAAEFSDAAVLSAMLAFEVGLARVEAQLGLIPSNAVAVIERAAAVDPFDAEAIAREGRQSGTIVLPLVRALTERVQAIDPPSAGFVHWGATSQDVADTALVLCVARAHRVIAADHRRIVDALRALSDRHASTVMLGRTLLQEAPPITFGLKVAGWFGAVSRNWTRLVQAADEALVLQCGGAVGTMAALGSHGPAVSRALANELGLTNPVAPWHTHRDCLAALVSCHGVYLMSLGKIARDISLLMQGEVAEAAERGGGSSTMPHKRNPAGAAVVLAAATRAPGLVATFLTGMVQEHERGVGGWHAEWPTVASLIQATGAAVAAMAGMIDGLTVSPDEMRRHIDETNGVVFAERVLMRLAPALGRDAAHRLLSDAVGLSRDSDRALSDVLAEISDVTSVIPIEELRSIDRPEDYLGAAETLRVALLGES